MLSDLHPKMGLSWTQWIEVDRNLPRGVAPRLAHPSVIAYNAQARSEPWR